MPKAFVSNLNDNTRTEMIDLLNARLADAIALGQSVKQAHWAIKGPSFIGIHELLDAVADRVRDGVDTLAERAVILGGQPHGTLELAAEKSSLEPYPIDAQDQTAHVEALTERFMDYGAKLRIAMETAGEAGDEGTADLFTEISRITDKDAWFIGAHATRGDDA
ncbi:MAG: DNA starvation/stationary phase protection protein Dps [Pseudomonadota bacterium]